MGITPEQIIKLPVDESFRMRTSLLEEYYQKALQEGKQVFCVIASAPSTSTGTYDNLEETARFCQKHRIWFHTDGAHGASVIFSKKYRHLIKGIEHADSIVVDFHKTMLTPSISTAVLLKNPAYAYDTFHQPDSNILCFRFINCSNPNEFNTRIREELIKEGDFYIVQTTIKENLYLRVTLLNPGTTKDTISELLNRIRDIASRQTNELFLV